MEIQASFLVKVRWAGNSAFTKLKTYQVCNSTVVASSLKPIWSLKNVIKILLAGFSAVLTNHACPCSTWARGSVFPSPNSGQLCLVCRVLVTLNCTSAVPLMGAVMQTITYLFKVPAVPWAAEQFISTKREVLFPFSPALPALPSHSSSLAFHRRGGKGELAISALPNGWHALKIPNKTYEICCVARIRS